jgi:hypothetical protein
LKRYNHHINPFIYVSSMSCIYNLRLPLPLSHIKRKTQQQKTTSEKKNKEREEETKRAVDEDCGYGCGGVVKSGLRRKHTMNARQDSCSGCLRTRRVMVVRIRLSIGESICIYSEWLIAAFLIRKSQHPLPVSSFRFVETIGLAHVNYFLYVSACSFQLPMVASAEAL